MSSLSPYRPNDALRHPYRLKPLSKSLVRVLFHVAGNLGVGHVLSQLDLALHGRVEVLVGFQVGLRVPVWLQNKLLVFEIINIIESFDAFRVCH